MHCLLFLIHSLLRISCLPSSSHSLVRGGDGVRLCDMTIVVWVTGYVSTNIRRLRLRESLVFALMRSMTADRNVKRALGVLLLTFEKKRCRGQEPRPKCHCHSVKMTSATLEEYQPAARLKALFGLTPLEILSMLDKFATRLIPFIDDGQWDALLTFPSVSMSLATSSHSGET